MNITQPISVQHYMELLKSKGSGVLLDLDKMPGPKEHYAAFLARLETADLHRLYLWFEFRKYTGNHYSKLTDVGDRADQEPRVRRFIDGDPRHGKAPADLRSSSGLEPMFVAEGMHCGPLYAIDGNHRIIGQYRSAKGVDGVPIYILTHPRMMEWEYVGDVRHHWTVRNREEGLP